MLSEAGAPLAACAFKSTGSVSCYGAAQTADPFRKVHASPDLYAERELRPSCDMRQGTCPRVSERASHLTEQVEVRPFNTSFWLAEDGLPGIRSLLDPARHCGGRLLMSLASLRDMQETSP